MDIQEIRQILAKNQVFIKNTFFVREIGLFGSFVKEAARAGSDVDILIAFDKGHKDFFNYMRLKSYIEGLIRNKVDLVIKDALKPRIKDKILNEVEYV